MNRIFLSPPHMGGNEEKYVKNVFESNYIAPTGEFVDRLEEEICRYTGSKSAAALASGTAAIHLALRLAGAGAGDKVLVSTLTFIGPVSPVLYQNAQPVFIDSDRSWNLDPALLEKAIAREKPKALIVTHLYGQSADMERISEICTHYNITLIEDAAESLGALCAGRYTGTFGLFGIYSFNGNKIITTGGGGALVSSDADMIKHARKLAAQAREPELWYEHKEIGYNYRMSNLLAAVGVGQMKVLDERITKKRKIFEWYREALGDIEEISFMPEIENTRGIRWLTTLVLKKGTPMGVIEELDRYGIESRPVWKPMHLQPVFSNATVYGGKVSEKLFAGGVCLPSGTSLEKSDVFMIADIVRRAVC